MIINNNLNAMNAHRQMGMNLNANGNSMEKLSSGLRINRAGDDAAGLAISEKMRAQVRGLDMASKNAQDGISLIQTAEGALNETHAILQRMRELSVQSANDTNTDDDRAELQKEVAQLIQEIDRIATDTTFNTQKLFDGNFTGKEIHIGADAGQTLTIGIRDMGATTVLSVHAVDIASQGGADGAITTIDNAIKELSSERSQLGAWQNRLEHTTKNLDNASENLQAAESRIRDTDMAKEMMEFTRSNILNQASQAMLAQANQQPQAVLQLLR
ncbi:flagellin N-terminal helical domain-containing protein [Alkalihalobacterium chitinilyticum]|uniref:Flagellin n=1 Tax=Alkalihalobacterium chitinilyticum TaxID=2980103 RepID=A0ABT5VFD9_9BACI|nr:flagellin [Alkalihalobacterium chitinilyticum]MDE5414047.1 flagellin [Alkalihalobacterium chitinilyticum]